MRKKKEEEKKQIASNLGTDVSSSDFTQFIKLLRMSGVLNGEGETLLQSGLTRPGGPLGSLGALGALGPRNERPNKRPKRPKRPNRPRAKRPRQRPRPRPVYESVGDVSSF